MSDIIISGKCEQEIRSRLSEQQQNCLQQCRPLTALSAEQGQVIRITAAAGTGKTTTLLALMKQASELGHTHITYLTFNKAAAEEGRRKVASHGLNVDARTFHSCAHELVDRPPINSDDGVVKKWIEELCKTEINQHLRHLRSPEKNATSLHVVQERAHKDVVDLIFKTFSKFCQSSCPYEALQKPNHPDRWILLSSGTNLCLFCSND